MMTTSARFKPHREDGRALWRVAYDFLVNGISSGILKEGDTVSHEQFAREMEVEFPSSGYYQAVGKATAEFQREHTRSLVAVRGEGYQIVRGMAQVDKAGQEQQSSRRKLDKAIQTITTVSEDGLSLGQVKNVRKLQDGMRFLGQVMGATIDEVEQHKRDIDMLKANRLEDRTRQRATEDEMAQMRAQLEEQHRRADENRRRLEKLERHTQRSQD